MSYNHHDDPRSQAEWAALFGSFNRESVIEATRSTLLYKGIPYPGTNPPEPYYPRAKLLNRLALLSGRTQETVKGHLDAITADDESAPFMTQDPPSGKGAVVMFNSDHWEHHQWLKMYASIRQEGGRHD